MKKKKVLSTLLIAGMVASMMVGCGKSADDKKESDNSGVTTYTVGTVGAYPPFNLVNEKGEPDGYDIAVMKAIDDLNPDVEFKYEASVGGAMPIINFTKETLSSCGIKSIVGILNGTTNYILSRMASEGSSYDITLIPF